MGRNFGYHTRLDSDNRVKVCGGSFGGSIHGPDIERLSRLFSVRIKQSGVAVFVDSKGRDVRLYVSIDAGDTEKGKVALLEHRKERERKEREHEEREERERAEINELIGGLSHAEAVARLIKPADQ